MITKKRLFGSIYVVHLVDLVIIYYVDFLLCNHPQLQYPTTLYHYHYHHHHHHHHHHQHQNQHPATHQHHHHQNQQRQQHPTTSHALYRYTTTCIVYTPYT